MHLWWARRPLVACRAAVYGALVNADQWVQEVDLKNPPADAAKAEAMRNGAKKGLNRRRAKEFVTDLCKYPGSPRTIAEAQRHILIAHAGRLTVELEEWRRAEAQAASSIHNPKSEIRNPPPAWVEEFKFTGQKVTMEDITAGRAPRPRVLDMFAGGGAIPLEALRLGCEAYALDLNPVAHIIELCTLVYPQKYGKPDPTARGMTGPPMTSPSAEGGDKGGVVRSWGGLAEEVRHWGNWVLQKVKAEIGDLYPPIPDPKFWVGRAASPAAAPAAAPAPARAAKEPLPFFPSVKEGVAKTRRHLPHWEKDAACYFVTWRSAPGVELTLPARQAVLDNLLHWSGQRYDLWQAVVMPDHVHALLTPLPKPDGASWTLAEILHTAKGFTAKEINRV